MDKQFTFSPVDLSRYPQALRKVINPEVLAIFALMDDVLSRPSTHHNREVADQLWDLVSALRGEDASHASVTRTSNKERLTIPIRRVLWPRTAGTDWPSFPAMLGRLRPFPFDHTLLPEAAHLGDLPHFFLHIARAARLLWPAFSNAQPPRLLQR